jgi:hypothetical protein
VRMEEIRWKRRTRSGNEDVEKTKSVSTARGTAREGIVRYYRIAM